MENTFSVGSSLREGWRLFKENRSVLLKMTLTIGLLQLASSIFNVKHVETSGDVIMVLVSFAAGILGAICMMGMLGATIKLVRGQGARYDDLLPSWHTIWRFALVSLVSGIFIVLGFIALLVPGIYLMLRFTFARYIVVDMPQVGVFEALRKSGELTRGVKWELLGLLLVLLLINIVGLIPAGLGLLVTVPVSLLALSKVYTVLLANASAQAPAAA